MHLLLLLYYSTANLSNSYKSFFARKSKRTILFKSSHFLTENFLNMPHISAYAKGSIRLSFREQSNGQDICYGGKVTWNGIISTVRGQHGGRKERTKRPTGFQSGHTILSKSKSKEQVSSSYGHKECRSNRINYRG